MKSWFNTFLRQPWDKQILWSAAALALIPVLFTWLRADSIPASAAPTAVQDMSTHIPKGFVLIPIEVQNYEALDSILGSFALVDLYQTAPSEGAKTQLLGRNVRLLRAPHNPSHFAVLVPENEAPAVLRFGGPFTVIVKRPGKSGTEFVKEPTRTRRSITYEGS
ncbi:MAG: hypothetical protein KF799_12910 [Bdellovibrionales bacterium]|nr:hypothetical protein [Bdellovibrionales bacterium]